MKKIGLLVLAVVLALGLVGAAFAAWDSSATVVVNDTMGTVQVGVQAVSGCVNTGSMLASAYSGWYPTVTQNVTNAAPGDVINCTFVIANTGTLPVTLSIIGTAITSTDGGSGILSDASNNVVYTESGAFSGTQSGSAPTTFASFVSAMAQPLAPGASVTVAVKLTLDSTMSQSLQGLNASSGFTVLGTLN